MAIYKHEEFLEQTDDKAFDNFYEPETKAPYPGIYRCEGCGHEIAIAAHHTLPPQNHHQHKAPLAPIRWRLIVSHR